MTAYSVWPTLLRKVEDNQMNWDPEFEVVVGLEVHAQLATNTKIFCACPAKTTDGKSVSEVESNRFTCPICAGHPGTLPKLNEKVVEYAVKAGLALGCEIKKHNVFSRKNYFYPDLPKAYQISQYDLPICENGFLDIELEGTGKDKTPTVKRIRVQRIHMEEDAGKNLHMDEFSLVNLNRAGVPLIEIVSHPDMRNPEEAGAYLRTLHAIITTIGVCDGNMQEGNFRCDANVSVMPKGSKAFGTRAEIKNVNSFRFVEKAIEVEIHRQIALVKSGGKVVQETRLYDSEKNQTFSMRSKEEAHDYRYFPEPDLVPVKLTDAFIERVRSTLPELPQQKKTRFVKDYGLSEYDAGVLTSDSGLSLVFDSAMKITTEKKLELKASAKSLSNFLTGEISRLLKEAELQIEQTKLTPLHIAETTEAVLNSVISNTAAKTVIQKVWETGESVTKIIEKEGLAQVSDTGALEKAIDEVIAENAGQAAEYRSGKEKLLGFFVGQTMKKTGGKANPALLQDLVKKKLSSS
jgi:aspartyl-tRNA(Asn)/glutamyl-tRNA(Gln) amidotransferase subunit B